MGDEIASGSKTVHQNWNFTDRNVRTAAGGVGVCVCVCVCVCVVWCGVVCVCVCVVWCGVVCGVCITLTIII